jgi:hypothetical protein
MDEVESEIESDGDPLPPPQWKVVCAEKLGYDEPPAVNFRVPWDLIIVCTFAIVVFCSSLLLEGSWVNLMAQVGSDVRGLCQVSGETTTRAKHALHSSTNDAIYFLHKVVEAVETLEIDDPSLNGVTHWSQKTIDEMAGTGVAFVRADEMHALEGLNETLKHMFPTIQFITKHVQLLNDSAAKFEEILVRNVKILRSSFGGNIKDVATVLTEFSGLARIFVRMTRKDCGTMAKEAQSHVNSAQSQLQSNVDDAQSQLESIGLHQHLTAAPGSNVGSLQVACNFADLDFSYNLTELTRILKLGEPPKPGEDPIEEWRKALPWAYLIGKLEGIARGLNEVAANFTTALVTLANINVENGNLYVDAKLNQTLKQAHAYIQSLVEGAAPVIRQAATPIDVTANLLNDSLDMFDDLDKRFDATSAAFEACSEQFHPFDMIKGEIWTFFSIYLLAAVITVILVLCLGLYAEVRLTKFEFEEHLGDPFFAKSVCAFHPRINELDVTWWESLTRPFSRWVMRMKHSMFYHRRAGLSYVAVHTLLFAVLLLSFVVLIVTAVLTTLGGWAYSGICSGPAAQLVNNAAMCDSFFDDLHELIGHKMLPNNCADSHILVCRDVVKPMNTVLGFVVILQILGILLLLSQKNLLIQEFKMILRDTLDDILEGRIKAA